MQPEFKWQEIKLAVGLGNPGRAYEHTFHNAGYAVLSALAKVKDASAFTAAPRKPFRFLRRETRLLVLPATFMNESGPAVREALRYFKATPKELLVVHDDTDLPLGTFRLQFGRGAAGHHGVQSVIAALHTKNFWRLRVGTRHPPTKASGRARASEIVLSPMTKTEQNTLVAVVAAIQDRLHSRESGYEGN